MAQLRVYSLLTSAWLSLFFERLWQAFSAGFLLFLLFLSVATYGLFIGTHNGLRLFIIFIFLGGIFWLFKCGWPAFKGLPTSLEARRSLEARQKRVQHAPFSLLEDAPAGTLSSLGTKLWVKAKITAQEDVKKAHFISPYTQFLKADPWALRYLLFLVCLGGVWQDAGTGFLGVRSIFTPLNPLLALTTQAQVQPPEYAQNWPNQLLADGVHQAILQHSILQVRVYGTTQIEEAPHLLLGEEKHLFKCEGEVCSTLVTLKKGGNLKVFEGSRLLFKAELSLLPDALPVIEQTKPFTRTPEGQITLHFQAEDDYGLKEAAALFSRGGRTVRHKLLLPKIGAKKAKSTSYIDLTTDLFAGLGVDFALEVTDVAGQRVTTLVEKIQLPERPFYHKIAKRLVAMRRALLEEEVQGPILRPELEGFLAAPDTFENNIRAYLSLRLAAENTDDPNAVYRLAGLLWDAALHIEKGPLGLELESLLAAQKALQEALSQGENSQKIKALFQVFAQKMASFLQRVQFPAANEDNGLNPGLKGEDFLGMLDEISALLDAGATEEAQKRLKDLETLLAHLSFGNEAAFNAFKEVFETLEKITKGQRALIEENFNKGDIKPLSAEQQTRQKELAEMLRDAIQAFKSFGASTEDFEKAVDDMELAAKAGVLVEYARPAWNLQNTALKSLEKAREDMAQSLRQQAGYGGLKGFKRDPSGQLHPEKPQERYELFDANPAVLSRQIRDLLFERAGRLEGDDATHKYLERLLEGF